MIAPVPLSPLASGYDHILLDLDGCVWVGDEATPRAAEAVAALRAAGKRVAFVTNDARHSSEEFVRKLWSLGLQASLAEVVTVGGAVQHLLADRFAGASAVVIGSPAMHRHVTDAGLRVVNATDMVARARVVVVAVHDDFDYTELRDAVLAVRSGALLIAAARDPTYPKRDGLWPGTGSLLAAIEVAADAHDATVVGKPAPQLFLTALDRLGPGRALMVGDRLDADVAGARAAGIDAALVLTGGTDRQTAMAAMAPAAAGADGPPRPVAVAENLGDLILGG
jgi:HAD superfamily hydrolase (TIGR01450 family)